MRVKKNNEEWTEEEKYIVRVCGENGVPVNFNKDEQCFFDYVTMQSNFAYRDGFPKIAGAMRKAYNGRNSKNKFSEQSLWGI